MAGGRFFCTAQSSPQTRRELQGLVDFHTISRFTWAICSRLFLSLSGNSMIPHGADSHAPLFCRRRYRDNPWFLLAIYKLQNTKYIIVTTPAQFISLSAMAFALSAACKKLDFQLTHLPYLQLNSTQNSFSDKPTPWRGEVCIWRYCLQTKEYGI